MMVWTQLLLGADQAPGLFKFISRAAVAIIRIAGPQKRQREHGKPVSPEVSVLSVQGLNH